MECGHDDGRQAAGGCHVDCGRRGSDGGGEPWGLWHGHDECLWSDETHQGRLAVLRAMEQLRGEELAEGAEEGLVDRARWPMRSRLWWAWRYRRRRRLWAAGAVGGGGSKGARAEALDLQRRLARSRLEE
eukprot:SAG11_NODE_1030_length_6119_cov_7.559302_8_plen_130_part_00